MRPRLRILALSALVLSVFALPAALAQTAATLNPAVPTASPAPVPPAASLAPSVPAAPKPAAPKPAYLTDPKFVEAMAEGHKLIKEHRYTFAVDAFKKANKIAGEQCFECLDDAFEVQMSTASYKEAVKTSLALEALAPTAALKSRAEARHGEALFRQGGDKPKPAQLQAADTVLKAALSENPRNLAARFTDGCVLAHLGDTEAARQQFKACAEAASPKDPGYVRVQHFAENPALALAKMAPAFTVTTLDGSSFNLDQMNGRVVLIDFWATWCGPCNEELPHLQKIAKEFAGQPLVIISVSWDKDESKWKEFINKHEMTWVQYRDEDHSLSNRFGVEAIPHYFTIDSDGVLTAEMLGSGSNVEGKLKKLLARTRPLPAPQTVASN